MTVRGTLKALGTPFRRAHGRTAMANGRISSTRPLCREFGYSRGTPIDRYYIERFLQDHAADIHGRVLEVGDDSYSRRFGGDRVEQQDVLHIDAGHPGATITGDLAGRNTLPTETFDCIVLTQTLHLIFDMAVAVQTLRDALRPDGVLLMTVPGISAVDVGRWKDSWNWSLTDLSLGRLLSGSFDADKVSLRTGGNLFAATAFLHGAAVEEIDPAKLDLLDAAYPVMVAARAQA